MEEAFDLSERIVRFAGTDIENFAGEENVGRKSKILNTKS